MARLRAISGPLAGQTIEVENEIVIGRQNTDVAIDDLELSRRHAVVRRHANRLQVEDLGSSNGTFVNGNRIEGPTLLGGGAELRVGTTVLVVEGVLPVQSAHTAAGAAETVISPADELGRDATKIRSDPRAASQTLPPPAPSPPSHEPTVRTGAPSTGQPAAPATAASPPRSSGSARTPAGPVGEFRPPQRAHRQGLATRSWIPVALSFGTVIAVAIALVIYFSQHT